MAKYGPQSYGRDTALYLSGMTVQLRPSSPGTRRRGNSSPQTNAEVHHWPPRHSTSCVQLVQRKQEVIPKGELLSLVWPEAFVVDANLNVLIGEIRRALDDDPRQPRYIRTVHGVGYAFFGDAVEEDGLRRREPREGAAFYFCCWKERTFVLSEGEECDWPPPGVRRSGSMKKASPDATPGSTSMA